MMKCTGRALQLQRVLTMTPTQMCTRCTVYSFPATASLPAVPALLQNPRVCWLSSLAQQQPSSSQTTNNQDSGALKEQPSQQLSAKRKRRRREIMRMDESEYEGYALLVPKLPLIDRRGEAQSHFLRSFAPEKNNTADFFSVMHHDWDLRSVAVNRWWSSLQVEKQVHMQEYNPKRMSILGSDLGAAHFIVFRKGKVRFKGHEDWIVHYRKDAKPGMSDDDLPIMRFELCSMPIRYDPNYRVEAIDCSGVEIRYEGLLNFQNLDFVKWLSFKDCPHIDDWCLDRIARCFHETIQYIDVSGCTRLSDKGIGALHRCKNLRTLKVEDMSHVKNLEIVCALLEDHIPGLSVLGVDYEKKTHDMRTEAAEIERKAKEEVEKLEAQTATIEIDSDHRSGPFATPK